MKIGTKSLLFGAHQFILHPVLVFIGWWMLYGFPFDPRLWIAFIIHDWGYWGKPNMDGAEGKDHPYWAAEFMDQWFGYDWGDLCLYHSRTTAVECNERPSKLCAADKMVTSLTPGWLYLPMARATGELEEYMSEWVDTICTDGWTFHSSVWYNQLQEATRNWAERFAGKGISTCRTQTP